jgi:transglutaminase-like putative cysteine protease
MVEPAADLFAYWDYWGALVHAFDVHDPHQSLVITSKAIVETAFDLPVPTDRSLGAGTGRVAWDGLADAAVQDRFYELLAPSPLVPPGAFGQVASRTRDGCSTPEQAALAAVEWAHDQLEYGPGTTHVGTSAVEAWHAGRGVCQDFAHISLGVLRAMGVPARYVSGYFYPKAEGTVGAKVVGESHAWVEAWTGHWAAYDPTNRVSVGERHVIVARGRDYSDVSPLRGIYSGPAGSSTEVTVELVRRA